MMKKIFLIFILFFALSLRAQEKTTWTDTDRKYLLDNLIRSRDELVKETENLTKAQWSFKEIPERWSINQIVEHIALWEMLLDYDISRAISAGMKPDLVKTANPDSTYASFIMEDKPHYSLDYTKPFSFTIPMGINELKNNVAWFLKLRNESIEYVRTTKDDLRAYFSANSNVHQRYIILFGHTDRHLRQLRKVKKDPKYRASF